MLYFRIAAPQDGDSLSKIYAPYVLNTAITFEVTPPDGEEFARRIARTAESYPYLVAEENGKIIGYAYASRYRERAAFAFDAELSVYLNEECRGKGLGKRFYATLIKILKMQNIVSLYASVTDDNPASISLHEKLGFTAVGTFHRAGYKAGAWHDVIWFEKQINVPENPPKDFISFTALDGDTVKKIIESA